MAEPKFEIGTTRHTGHRSPESAVYQVTAIRVNGEWEPFENGTTGPFGKGNRFPPYRNAAAQWTLITYA